MAELQKLIQAKGTETSELMKMYLSEAQHSFREHAKSSQIKIGSSSSQIIGPNFLITSSDKNGNNSNLNNSGSLTTSSLSQQQQTAADINLNVCPPSSGNLNLTSGDLLTTGSPSPGLQSPSPFDLGMADLSPLPAGLNLNLGGFDNICLTPTGGNLNGNPVYSPSTQSLTDNMTNSPMIMPGSLDNLDPCSPSEYFTGNMTTTTTSSGTSPANLGTSPQQGNNTNMNFLNQTTSGGNNFLSGASVCPPNLDNLKINTNTGSGVNANLINQPHTLLSPGTIKQEPVDTAFIKSEPANPVPSPCQGPSKTTPTEVKGETSSANRLFDVERVLEEAQMTPEHSRLLLLNQVTDIIVEAHMGTTINTHSNVMAAKERITGCKLDPDDTIPDLDFSKLSLSASDLWQQFLTAFVPEITKVVKFSKKLPGFSDFHQGDQIKLIKQGAFEVMLARYSILVDEVNELMLDPKLEMMSPRSVVVNLPMGPFLDEFFPIAKKFNPLRLSDGEIALFTAILMICPDRQGLENQSSITRIQDLILQALYLLMKQNTTREVDAETTFRSLVNMINYFHKVNDEHTRFLNNIKMSSPTVFNQQFPALHQEVFDDSLFKTQEVE